MKKIIYGLVLFLFGTTSVLAKNNIYNIDMNIYLDEQGNAFVTENWSVKGSDGTEWYKGLKNMGLMELKDFKVSMDNTPLTEKDWDINETLSEKKGFYGINYTDGGLELCFGKYDYKKHIFTLTYTLTNAVFNTEDSQVFYNTLIDRLSNVNFENFSVNISSYYDFPDTLDVWGYGYKGYAYVNNGTISMSNEENTKMKDSYVVLLVKFPQNTFVTEASYSHFKTFNSVYETAEDGSFDYDYEEKASIFEVIFGLISTFAPFIFIGILLASLSKNKYGFKNNKVIDKKNTPYFREIPCNKDIYYANTLTKLNIELFNKYKETNILGAIILKWVKEDKVVFKNIEKGIFNKETSTIDLTLNPTFDNVLEKELFDTMYEASKDGILEPKELETWARKHYSKFFNLFERINKVEMIKLENANHVYKRTTKEECKYKNVMDDTIYEESTKLYGLKRYLDEFSRIDTKEVLEVKLWDEYLMFAYIFGIADKVAKQLKNMYPEVLADYNCDYDTLIFINNISTSTVRAATNARSAAESYSSGGGGFSSGGGGGGSFGGGGGGGSR